MSDVKIIEDDQAVTEVRKAARQFAMLYFNFCKVLVEELGLELAKKIVNKSVFGLAIDRTNQLRQVVQAQGEETNLENFNKFSDLGKSGWVKELGRDHCPYAQTWVTYYEKYPWFRELAPFYCDIIDTTNIENFTKTLSHKLTKNVLWGDETCEREYFLSEDVKQGKFTYDPDNNTK